MAIFPISIRSKVANVLVVFLARRQIFSLASSTLKLAASALHFQQQQKQQQQQQQQQKQQQQQQQKQQQQKCETECESKSASSAPLTEYSLKEVLWHDSPDDCWIVIYDKVYDVTRFLELVGPSLPRNYHSDPYRIHS